MYDTEKGWAYSLLWGDHSRMACCALFSAAGFSLAHGHTHKGSCLAGAWGSCQPDDQLDEGRRRGCLATGMHDWHRTAGSSPTCPAHSAG